MNLKFDKTVLRCLGTALQEVRSTEVTQELRLSDGMPDIGRVLATWGQIVLRSKEWQAGTILLTGGVMIWTLYAPEDGTEPRSVESWIPFQLRWDTDETGREGPVRMFPLLRFADSRSISARKMMLRAGVAAMAQAFRPMEAEIYSAGELPEDVQVLKNTYPARIPVESGEKTFLMDEELMLPEAAVPAEKLLSVTVHPEISEKRVMSDKIIFKGTLQLHTVFRDQEGKVRSWTQPLAFSQLAELDNTYGQDAQVDFQTAVTSLEADMGEGGKLRIKCGLVAQYLVDERHLLELVQDAYSPFRDVQTEETMLELPVVLEDRMEYISAEQTLPGQNGQVADAVFLPDFPRRRQNGSELELELPGLFQALVYDENNTPQGLTSRWEGRISIPADENSQVMATVKSAGDVQNMASMDGIMLSSQMQLRLRTGSEEGIPMVTGLELGQLQEPEASRPSVILCTCRDESLWEIAKRCGSTVDAIRSANGIVEEPNCEQMILIPVL